MVSSCKTGIFLQSSPAPQPDPDRQLPSCERRSYTSPEELKFHTNSPSKANRCSSSTKTRKSPETTNVPLRSSGWCKRPPGSVSPAKRQINEVKETKTTVSILDHYLPLNEVSHLLLCL
ncbi:hypothetical protein AMECASPLE_024475 [Ameca splendens]|uniref:Uncharacterized protein n=1 Tax=Ameca splendens TaxID=208324 RepID=A0ABV0XHD4_9TELE